MDFNANPRVITAKIPRRSHGLAVWNGVFALTVHALEGARTVTKIFELGERESEMEFVDKTRGYHMDDSYEYNPAAESRPGTQSKKKRKSRAGLFVLVFLILMAVGLFVLYSDMKRDLRHGVYRCEDQRMMELPIEPDQEKISMAADSIRELAQAYPEIRQYMMLIPSAACVQSGYIPSGIRIRDQVSDLNGIRQSMPAELSWIDLLSVFSQHSGEKLYYATDIYLTGWGSRYAANTALAGMGAEMTEGKDVCYLLSDSFRGKLAADGTLLQRILKTKKERLEIYVPESEAPYYRVDDASGKRFGSLYDSDAVKRENCFDVFFGGERPLTEIWTGAVNGEILFVIGDREADSIVPRFVSSYEKIILIHPSKCTSKIDKLIRKYQPTKILYLYGANSFMQDRALLHMIGK